MLLLLQLLVLWYGLMRRSGDRIFCWWIFSDPISKLCSSFDFIVKNSTSRQDSFTSDWPLAKDPPKEIRNSSDWLPIVNFILRTACEVAQSQSNTSTMMADQGRPPKTTSATRRTSQKYSYSYPNHCSGKLGMAQEEETTQPNNTITLFSLQFGEWYQSKSLGKKSNNVVKRRGWWQNQKMREASKIFKMG